MHKDPIVGLVSECKSIIPFCEILCFDVVRYAWNFISGSTYIIPAIFGFYMYMLWSHIWNRYGFYLWFSSNCVGVVSAQLCFCYLLCLGSPLLKNKLGLFYLLNQFWFCVHLHLIYHAWVIINWGMQFRVWQPFNDMHFNKTLNLPLGLFLYKIHVTSYYITICLSMEK